MFLFILIKRIQNMNVVMTLKFLVLYIEKRLLTFFFKFHYFNNTFRYRNDLLPLGVKRLC